MNLREQFEKETGINALIHHRYDIENLEEAFDEEYVEWLEQRNKEQVEVLEHSYSQVTIALAHEDPIPTKVLVEWADQLEEQLKKSGEL